MTQPPEELGGHDVVRRDPSVTTEVLDGEAVVYAENGAMHVLNPTATVIWQLLDGHARLEDVADDLSVTFGAPYEVVLADVVRTARSLGGMGLLADVAATEPSATPPQREGQEPGQDPQFLPEPPYS